MLLAIALRFFSIFFGGKCLQAHETELLDLYFVELAKAGGPTVGPADRPMYDNFDVILDLLTNRSVSMLIGCSSVLTIRCWTRLQVGRVLHARARVRCGQEHHRAGIDRPRR